MRCPVCSDRPLRAEETDEALLMPTCAKCGGRFLAAEAYRKWVERRKANVPEMAADAAGELDVQESRQAKLCPECHAILVPYRVGHDVPFSLDHCAHCGGVWFERNEWETLRARNLHDDLHFVFTQTWQHGVAKASRARQREIRLRRTFGNADYEELVRVKAWLDAHPHSREFYAFLLHSEEF